MDLHAHSVRRRSFAKYVFIVSIIGSRIYLTHQWENSENIRVVFAVGTGGKATGFIGDGSLVSDNSETSSPAVNMALRITGHKIKRKQAHRD